jgi:hypothetical protein
MDLEVKQENNKIIKLLISCTAFIYLMLVLNFLNYELVKPINSSHANSYSALILIMTMFDLAIYLLTIGNFIFYNKVSKS